MSEAQFGTCSICRVPLTSQREFEGRRYCASHLNELSLPFPPLWRATSLSITGLLILVGLLGLINAVASDGFGRLVQIGEGVVLSTLPLLIWLLSLYRSARKLEHSIPTLLPVALFLGFLVAAALSRPLLFDVLNLDLWMSRTSPANRFLAHILIGGVIHMALILAIIRFAIWPTDAFTRRVEGMLFSMSAAWGYVVALNVLFVIDQGGLALLNGGLRLLTTTAAFLTSSVVLGYFVGRNRFEDLPFYYLSMGLAASAFVNGLFNYVGIELNSIRLNLTSDGFSPWPGLVVNMIGLVIAVLAVYGLFSRYNALSRARLGLE